MRGRTPISPVTTFGWTSSTPSTATSSRPKWSKRSSRLTNIVVDLHTKNTSFQAHHINLSATVPGATKVAPFLPILERRLRSSDQLSAVPEIDSKGGANGET